MAGFKMACRCPGCGMILENGTGVIEYETDSDTILINSFDDSWFHCSNCDLDIMVGDVEDSMKFYESYEKEEKDELLEKKENKSAYPPVSVVYITKTAVKTGIIYAASVERMGENGEVYCKLHPDCFYKPDLEYLSKKREPYCATDNFLYALYKPGEWYYTPEEALEAVEHERKAEIERLKTLEISIDCRTR